MVNRLLLRANRANKQPEQNYSRAFLSLYITLIALSLVAAIIIPWALGVFTLPGVLQNVMGILFAICPCTLAIAHQLPSLLSTYQHQLQGVCFCDQ